MAKAIVLTKIALIALITTITPLIGSQAQDSSAPKEVTVDLYFQPGLMTKQEASRTTNTLFDKTDAERSNNLGIQWNKTEGLCIVQQAWYTENGTQGNFQSFLPQALKEALGIDATDGQYLFPGSISVEFARQLRNSPVTITRTYPHGTVRFTFIGHGIPSLPFSGTMKLITGVTLAGIVSLTSWLARHSKIFDTLETETITNTFWGYIAAIRDYFTNIKH
jgi:hypothetical protein